MSWCNAWEANLAAILRVHGKQSAISAPELAALLHRDPRAVRAQIAHLRSATDGHCLPICSVSAHRNGEPSGYFWPANAEEANATLAQLGSRRAEIQAAMDGITEGIRREFGQQEFDFGSRAA